MIAFRKPTNFRDMIGSKKILRQQSYPCCKRNKGDVPLFPVLGSD